MKVSGNPKGDGYLVSDNNEIIAVVPNIGDAQRIMGIEPSPDDYDGGRGRAIAPLF